MFILRNAQLSTASIRGASWTTWSRRKALLIALLILIVYAVITSVTAISVLRTANSLASTDIAATLEGGET